MSSIKQNVRQFIIANRFGGGQGPDQLGDESPLIESGVLDSLNIFKVIVFIEQSYGFAIEIEDASRANFATLNAIESFVRRRQAANATP